MYVKANRNSANKMLISFIFIYKEQGIVKLKDELQWASRTFTIFDTIIVIFLVRKIQIAHAQATAD